MFSTEKSTIDCWTFFQKSVKIIKLINHLKQFHFRIRTHRCSACGVCFSDDKQSLIKLPVKCSLSLCANIIFLNSRTGKKLIPLTQRKRWRMPLKLVACQWFSITFHHGTSNWHLLTHTNRSNIQTDFQSTRSFHRYTYSRAHVSVLRTIIFW